MKLFKKISVFAGLISIGFLVHSCDDMVNSSDDVVFPEENVSWQEHVEPFIKLTCAYGDCHSKNSQTPMTDYFTLMSQPGMVISGKPENSKLYQVLTGDLPHPTYFYDKDISQNHVDGIGTWIEEGAEFN